MSNQDLQSTRQQVTYKDLPSEDCKCTRISGHLEAVKWLLWPREYRSSPGYLRIGDWTTDYYIWLHYVESNNGLLADDDVLLTTDSRYWSIHDVQRYFYGDLHCEKVLFTYQYPNLRMPSHLGSYLWKANTALKLPSAVYMKEFHRSLETTLKKMEAKEVQMDRLIISDQLIKIDLLDIFKRKTFLRILLNILSFQDHLQLVSFENLCCKRIEGVRLIQQLACFNASSIKYLFLWRFVLPNENPILVNYSYVKDLHKNLKKIETEMTSDEDKIKIAKLLQNLQVKEVKLSERSSALVTNICKEFGQADDEPQETEEEHLLENPYKVDHLLLEENERKLKELLCEGKRAKKVVCETVVSCDPDYKRPWRINSNREKLLRIDSELTRHLEKASQLILPMADGEMRDLIKECQEEIRLAATPTIVPPDRLRATIEAARKNLPNFQYRVVDNSTATQIMPNAHDNEIK